MSTEIQWTDETWNPMTGCTKVSAGCAHCYIERTPAFRIAKRRFYKGHIPVDLHYTRLEQPLHWRKPRRVFVNSLSDLFHDNVPDTFIDLVFAVMALSPRHTFQVLTKRPVRMRKYLSASDLMNRLDDSAGSFGACHANLDSRWPLPNVWLGVSVENQKFADQRIPLLLQTPAAVRFISAEPLLGPVDLNALPDPKGDPCWDASALFGVRENPFGATVSREQVNKLDWVIVGGESGPGARRLWVPWVRSIKRDCLAAGVPVFIKQLGANISDRNDAGFEGDTPTSWMMDTDSIEELDARSGCQGDPVRILLNDRKGGDMAEWPEDLRIREFPRGSELQVGS